MSFRIRLMTLDDIAAGIRLKDLAGWNQTEQDWLRFLRSSPDGCFVAESNGQVAGTVTTIVYENRFAWIGMVLVDPELRGKGIGTALLERAIDHLDGKGVPCLKLDATPQGRPLYARLGFRVEYEIERSLLERIVSAPARGELPPPARELPGEVLEMDHEVFGADRSALIRSLAEDAPEYVLLASESGALSGYGFGRRGSRADHLGPWVASSHNAAREILETFLERSQRHFIFADVLKDSPWAAALASQHGLRFSRTLTRMYRGENSYPGRVELLGAIVGPEFG